MQTDHQTAQDPVVARIRALVRDTHSLLQADGRELGLAYPEEPPPPGQPFPDPSPAIAKMREHLQALRTAVLAQSGGGSTGVSARELTALALLETDQSLEKLGADVQVRVFDEPAGTPLAGVKLEIDCALNAEGLQPAGAVLWQNGFSSLSSTYFEGAPSEPFHATTGADGRCVLRCLEPGQYQMWLDHEGYLETAVTFTVSADGGPEPLEIPMTRGRRIAGTLHAAGLSPLPSVQVGLATEDDRIMYWATLDGAHFEFEPVEPGSYEIRVVSQADPKQVLASLALTLSTQDNDDLVITLDR